VNKVDVGCFPNYLLIVNQTQSLTCLTNNGRAVDKDVLMVVSNDLLVVIDVNEAVTLESAKDNE
jgi:hypothetical protein